MKLACSPNNEKMLFLIKIQKKDILLSDILRSYEREGKNKILYMTDLTNKKKRNNGSSDRHGKNIKLQKR